MNEAQTMQPDATGGAFPGLTPEQAQAAILIASGDSNAQAAETIGVDRSTVWRWVQLETFEAAVNALQLDAQRQLGRGLIARVPKALRTLDALLDSANDGVRLRAALAVLDRAKDTDVGPADAESIARTDARRLFPDWTDFSPTAFAVLRRAFDGLEKDDSPEARNRIAYAKERAKALGLGTEPKA